MTDRGMATNTYIEPLTAEYVEKDSFKRTVRTQLSPVWAVRQVLTLLRALRQGRFEKYNMKVIGTSDSVYQRG